jgi:hypothetical protein
MIEKSHPANQNMWWPNLMDPLRHAGERTADKKAQQIEIRAV